MSFVIISLCKLCSAECTKGIWFCGTEMFMLVRVWLRWFLYSCLLTSLLAVHFPSQTRIKFQLPLDLVQESLSSAYKQEPHLHIVFPRRLKCYNDASRDANNVCFTLRCFQISVYELCSSNSCEGRDMLCTVCLVIFFLLEINNV